MVSLSVPYANGYNHVFGYRMDNHGGRKVCKWTVREEILVVLYSLASQLACRQHLEWDPHGCVQKSRFHNTARRRTWSPNRFLYSMSNEGGVLASLRILLLVAKTHTL